jgi:hypothetical protein
MRYYLTVRCGPAGTVLDVIHLTFRVLIEFKHVRSDMWKRGLLADEVTATGYTMFQRDRFYLATLVFIDHLTNLRIYRMKFHLEAQIVGIELDLMTEF